MTVKEEIRDILVDFGKHMDTTIPKNANGDLFISLKYSNKERMREFCKEHDVDRLLLEQVAIADFMLQNKEAMVEKINQYTIQPKQKKRRRSKS